jgi:glycosyltransferase involved in cell wall biosynthesis
VHELAQQPVADRLRVVHEGVAEEFFQPASAAPAGSIESLQLNGAPYFLWTGSLNPRKNLRNVVRAFDLVVPRLPHHLVLAGGLGWDHKDVFNEISSTSTTTRDRIHRPGYVSDATLRALYRGATAFLYVSLLEGFGLPILEAMASGCPVVTSNASCMPEIAGGAALLVDPLRPEEIADAMLRLAGNEPLHQDFQMRGRERAAHFSWQRCARQMAQIYRELI